MRAAYVIGTRHNYQLFVPRELVPPDLAALTGQVMRQREDKGSSLRFETAETYNMPPTGWQRMPPARSCVPCWRRGREALIAAQAERARLRQIEELLKAQEVKHTLRPRGPSFGR